jgi:death on curing protein
VNVAYLSVQQVLVIHHEVMADEGQQAVLIAPDKLESALLRPQAEAFGEEFFPSLAEKASVLLQGIVIAHPFLDGNKRAGLGAMLMLLRLNRIRTVPDLDELYEFVIAVTTGELREVEEIADRVRVLFPGS